MISENVNDIVTFIDGRLVVVGRYDIDPDGSTRARIFSEFRERLGFPTEVVSLGKSEPPKKRVLNTPEDLMEYVAKAKKNAL